LPQFNKKIDEAKINQAVSILPVKTGASNPTRSANLEYFARHFRANAHIAGETLSITAIRLNDARSI